MAVMIPRCGIKGRKGGREGGREGGTRGAIGGEGKKRHESLLGYVCLVCVCVCVRVCVYLVALNHIY